jgi:hypothetical protein
VATPLNGALAVSARNRKRLLAAQVLVQRVCSLSVDEQLVHHIKLKAKLAYGRLSLLLRGARSLPSKLHGS